MITNDHMVVPPEIIVNVRIFKINGITKESLIEVCNSLYQDHNDIESAVMIDESSSDYLMILLKYLKEKSVDTIFYNGLEDALIRSNGASAYPLIKSIFSNRDFSSVIDNLAFGRCDLDHAGSAILA